MDRYPAGLAGLPLLAQTPDSRLTDRDMSSWGLFDQREGGIYLAIRALCGNGERCALERVGQFPSLVTYNQYVSITTLPAF